MIKHAIAVTHQRRPNQIKILEPESAERNWPVIFETPPTNEEREAVYRELLAGNVVKRGPWTLEPVTEG